MPFLCKTERLEKPRDYSEMIFDWKEFRNVQSYCPAGRLWCAVDEQQAGSEGGSGEYHA